MIDKFDHIGVVVQNTEEMVSLFSDLFGFKVRESITFQEDGFRSTLVSKGEVTIEFIEPIGSEGIIQSFVKKRGWGLHHISIQVEEIEAAMKVFKEKGVRLVKDEPQDVKGTTDRTAFIHPRSTGGILIELVQHKKNA